MELSKVSAKEYNNYFATVFHVFNTVEFSELNSNKCESIHYLLFIDKKVRLGIVICVYAAGLAGKFCEK